MSKDMSMRIVALGPPATIRTFGHPGTRTVEVQILCDPPSTPGQLAWIIRSARIVAVDMGIRRLEVLGDVHVYIGSPESVLPGAALVVFTAALKFDPRLIRRMLLRYSDGAEVGLWRLEEGVR